MFKFIFPKIHISIERWKYNKNYNIYVSNFGNFKDIDKKNIKQKINQHGYMEIPVCNNKKNIIKYILSHRVVMETWCPRENMWKDRLTVDHLDHNKRNNKIKNLEWVSERVNFERAMNDHICDEKDIIIQRLKGKLRNLEEEMGKNNVIIIADDKDIFTSWNDVYSFLLKIQPNIKGMKLKNMINKIIKCSESKQKKYCGLKWKVERREVKC